MSRGALLATVVVGLLVATAGRLEAGQTADNPFVGNPEAITDGRELMAAVCGGYCHATAEGETTDAPDLFDCEWWHGDTDSDLFGVIRGGVPDTRMQSFGGILADDDIWRLVTMIRADSRCEEDTEATADSR